QMHMIIHSGYRPFSCTVCYKAFCHAGSLERHNKIHKGDRPAQCKPPERACRGLQELKQHKRRHARERLHEMDICNRALKLTYKHKMIDKGDTLCKSLCEADSLPSLNGMSE